MTGEFVYCQRCGAKLLHIDEEIPLNGRVRLEIVCKNRVDSGKGVDGTRSCRQKNVVILGKPLDGGENVI